MIPLFTFFLQCPNYSHQCTIFLLHRSIHYSYSDYYERFYGNATLAVLLLAVLLLILQVFTLEVRIITKDLLKRILPTLRLRYSSVFRFLKFHIILKSYCDEYLSSSSVLSSTVLCRPVYPLKSTRLQSKVDPLFIIDFENRNLLKITWEEFDDRKC